MSQILIQRYLGELSDLRRVSGTSRETVVREAFKTLLKSWGKSRDLIFVPEYEIGTLGKERRYVDGALVDQIRLPMGFWEAKDGQDNIDQEIENKFRRGYPQENIIFEDSHEAILIQNKKSVVRCEVTNVSGLEKLLSQFFQHESPPSIRFRKAVEQFKTDLPDVLETLRSMIDVSLEGNTAFKSSAEKFLRHARATIHPDVTPADVREMLIQHILTEDIFSKVFGQDEFHRKNNIAQALYKLEATFFTGDVKWQTLKSLTPYYGAIHSAAAEIRNHHEKQTFLKVIYQNFYQVYNKKLADRLGVVYTPNEIVRFIIEGADFLCEKHFGKRLIERNVEILEPAAGTGTFVSEFIEYSRGQPAKLKHKYLEELHANEVAILPYYVANLNIETTYAVLANEYLEFPNLCFVDTLESVEGLGRFAGHQEELFGALSEENYERIKRQNKRKISVVIGNPPYNANQMNENDNNKNRAYPAIDERIKKTYIARSTAQKTKLYDMYIRFFRWASDRIHDAGIVAFITNRSFIDSRNADGFRRAVAEEFDEIYLIDLGGDWKKEGAAGGGNVFGIGTGVAISFWIRHSHGHKRKAKIEYAAAPAGTGEEKLSWLAALTGARIPLGEVNFEAITPQNGYWIDNPEKAFGSEIPLASKDVKSSKLGAGDGAIFKLFSLGIATNRDDWVYDHDRANLVKKVKHFIGVYESERKRWISSGRPENTSDWVRRDIKWTSELEAHLKKQTKLTFNEDRIRLASYRPFSSTYVYYDQVITHRPYQQDLIFPILRDQKNTCIIFTDPSSQKPWMVCASKSLADLHYVGAAAGSVCLPRFRYEGGEKIDNITDWALSRFQVHYVRGTNGNQNITKDAIFHYIYGVLHDPKYREQYALHLKRELPRIPFYRDFWKWADLGEELLNLHIGYEKAKPWKLTQLDKTDRKSRSAGLAPLAVLRADKDGSSIHLNGETKLTGIPLECWDYKLGNRTAVEWVLDQYSESFPRDPIVREKFDAYQFSDHKKQVIDLLQRVVRVSVETQNIVRQMKASKGD